MADPRMGLLCAGLRSVAVGADEADHHNWFQGERRKGLHVLGEKTCRARLDAVCF